MSMGNSSLIVVLLLESFHCGVVVVFTELGRCEWLTILPDAALKWMSTVNVLTCLVEVFYFYDIIRLTRQSLFLEEFTVFCV